jgi:hypothetical protein
MELVSTVDELCRWLEQHTSFRAATRADSILRVNGGDAIDSDLGASAAIKRTHEGEVGRIGGAERGLMEREELKRRKIAKQ